MKEEKEGIDVWDNRETLSGIRVKVEGKIKKWLQEDLWSH